MRPAVQRIGVDYLPATSHPPGVGRYVRELVRALVRLADRPDLALFEVGSAPRSVDPRTLGLSIGDARVARVESKRPRALVHATSLLTRKGVDDDLGGVDVFHHAMLAPRVLPVRAAKQSIAMAELPAEHSPQEALVRERLKRMDLVFAFSSDSRSQLMQRFGLEPKRVVFTPVGCEHWRRNLAALPAPEAPPKILVLGAVKASRRPVAVLRAFEILRERGFEGTLEFHCVPPPRGAPLDPGAASLLQALRSSKAHAAVTWSGLERTGRAQVPAPADFERELPHAVAEAACLVHLSSSEATPVTPLEALALGVPVVASRIPAFVEALGDAALLLDDAACVREPELLAEAIQSAIESRNDGWSAAKRELKAREFTWEHCAQGTLAAWRTLS